MIVAAKSLNGKGQCCGRKPIIYKRPHHLFCPRCNAAFDPADGKQVSNWAYKNAGVGRFEAHTTAGSPAVSSTDRGGPNG
jgi:hypothetical protein